MYERDDIEFAVRSIYPDETLKQRILNIPGELEEKIRIKLQDITLYEMAEAWSRSNLPTNDNSAVSHMLSMQSFKNGTDRIIKENW